MAWLGVHGGGCQRADATASVKKYRLRYRRLESTEDDGDRDEREPRGGGRGAEA